MLRVTYLPIERPQTNLVSFLLFLTTTTPRDLAASPDMAAHHT